MKAIKIETGEFITSLNPLTLGSESDAIDVTEDELALLNETTEDFGRPDDRHG